MARVSFGCGRAYRGLTAHPGRAPDAAAPKAGARAEDGAAVAAVTGEWQGSPLGQAAGAASPADPRHACKSSGDHPCPPAGSGRSSRQEETGILRDELIAKPCREMGRAEMTQIVVEVAELRPQHQGEDP